MQRIGALAVLRVLELPVQLSSSSARGAVPSLATLFLAGADACVLEELVFSATGAEGNDATDDADDGAGSAGEAATAPPVASVREQRSEHAGDGGQGAAPLADPMAHRADILRKQARVEGFLDAGDDGAEAKVVELLLRSVRCKSSCCAHG